MSSFHLTSPVSDMRIFWSCARPLGVFGAIARNRAVGAASSYMFAPVRTAQKSSVVSERITNTMYGGKLNRHAVESLVRSTTSSVKLVSFFSLPFVSPSTETSPSMHFRNAFRKLSSSPSTHLPSPPAYPSGRSLPSKSTHFCGVSGSIPMIVKLSIRSIQSRFRTFRIHPAIASCCSLFTRQISPKSNKASLPESVYSMFPSCGSACTRPVRKSCALEHSTPHCTILSCSSVVSSFIGRPSIHSCVKTRRPVMAGRCRGTTRKSMNRSDRRNSSALLASSV